MTDIVVHLTRTGLGSYRATNAAGAEIAFGSQAADGFTPVELLLAALAGCSAVDVDHVTSRRAEPETFEVVAQASKVTEGGNHLDNVGVSFTLAFPAGPDGDAARARIDQAIRRSHESLCTVSGTLERPTAVSFVRQDSRRDG